MVAIIYGAVIAAVVALIKWLFKAGAVAGVSFVVFKGVRALFDKLVDQALGYMNVTSPEDYPIMEWLGMLRLDVCMTIIISSVSIKITLSAIEGGMKMAFGGKK